MCSSSGKLISLIGINKNTALNFWYTLPHKFARGNPLITAHRIAMPHFAMFALLVADYDEAISWYQDKLGFKLVEDTDRGGDKRWVIMAPRGDQETKMLLAKAVNDEQLSRVGNQTGGRVFLFLHTDDFWADYNHMLASGVDFIDQPRVEDYGTVIVFRDLYGNKWDFIQPVA